MHAILWCSESCDCDKDEYDKMTFLVVTNEPLLWEYGTESSTEAAQWAGLLSKYRAELHSGLSFSRSLPQICAEDSGVPNFDYYISQFSEHLRMLLQSLRALCVTPGGSGSILKYLEALVMSPVVSGRIVCSFRTNLHCADISLWFLEVSMHQTECQRRYCQLV